jgi:hypothetical protein
MPNNKRPDLSAIPRLTEQLDGEELTAHFAVPRELLEKLRDDDDATRVQSMPLGLLDDEQTRQIAADSVHTSPTLPPPAPGPTTQQSLQQPSPPVGVGAFPPISDVELDAEVRAMRRPTRLALLWGLLLVSAIVLVVWRLLSP